MDARKLPFTATPKLTLTNRGVMNDITRVIKPMIHPLIRVTVEYVVCDLHAASLGFAPRLSVAPVEVVHIRSVRPLPFVSIVSVGHIKPNPCTRRYVRVPRGEL